MIYRQTRNCQEREQGDGSRGLEWGRLLGKLKAIWDPLGKPWSNSGCRDVRRV